MRWLVTLAKGEPYETGARVLQAFAESIGWGFACVRDFQGDRPWQAKRLALRVAFEAGAERVFFCDSDVQIRKPEALARILNQEGRWGVWARYPIPMEGYFQRQGMRNGPELEARVREFYASVCRAYGLVVGQAPHFSDWFVGYEIDPVLGLKLCDVWDEIAEALLRAGLSWSDGVSVGIAAAACGVPIRHNIKCREVRRALVHLRAGDKVNYNVKPGECAP